MKLSELAKQVGKSAPYVMTLQKIFGLADIGSLGGQSMKGCK